MRGRKTWPRVVLTTLERAELELRLRFMNTSLGLARQCRAILGVADSLAEKHVRKWVQRFLKDQHDFGLAVQGHLDDLALAQVEFAVQRFHRSPLPVKLPILREFNRSVFRPAVLLLDYREPARQCWATPS